MIARSLPVVILILASAVSSAAQTANYKNAVDQYRSGRYDDALAMYASMPTREIERSVGQISARALGKDPTDPPEPLWVAAALVLHTHAMASGDNRATPQALVDLLNAVKVQHADYNLIRCWYLFTSSRAQGNGGPRMAFRTFADAPPQVTAHPEAQLSMAAIDETGWMLVDEGRMDAPGDVNTAADVPMYAKRVFTPSLARAERLYRSALAGAPDLYEARVRLGRVLTLQKRPDEARSVLAALPLDVEPGYRFLAALFEGDARERQGDLEGAAVAYAVASALMPRAESAALALAHLRHAQGQRAEAFERTLAVTSGSDGGTDPWLWYRLGTAWRTFAYLEAMQRIVTVPRRD